MLAVFQSGVVGLYRFLQPLSWMRPTPEVWRAIWKIKQCNFRGGWLRSAACTARLDSDETSELRWSLPKHRPVLVFQDWMFESSCKYAKHVFDVSARKLINGKWVLWGGIGNSFQPWGPRNFKHISDHDMLSFRFDISICFSGVPSRFAYWWCVAKRGTSVHVVHEGVNNEKWDNRGFENKKFGYTVHAHVQY